MNNFKEEIRDIIKSILSEEAKSTEKYDDDPALKGDQDELPDHLQKAIIKKAKGQKKEMDESDTPHLKQYGAPQGSKRDKHLDYVQRLFKAADKLEKEGKTAEAEKKRQRAYDAREKEEEKRRSKGDYSKRKRKDTKKESVRMTEADLREFVREVLQEKLSAKTKATLKKKAEKRGLTPSSVYAEFRKGLAAWASSGSRKGMSQHQWAHARVNSATPSKPWAVVKKSKKKKKKKK